MAGTNIMTDTVNRIKLSRKLQVLTFIILFALIGAAYLIVSRALTPTAPIRPSAVATVSQKTPDTPNPGPVQFFTNGATAVAPDAQRSYLKFDTSGVAGTITKATLQLYVQTSNTNGFSAKKITDNNWNPATVTYKNVPSVGDNINDSGAVSANSWATVDVTSYVKTNAVYSFAIWPKDSNQIAYSNTGDTAPKLIVESSGPTADTQPPTDVYIAIPKSAETVSGRVNFDSGGKDNIGVGKVEFYVDGKLIGNAGPSPAYGWVIFDPATQLYGYDTAGSATQPKITDGGHSIYSVAYDGAGNKTQSGSVSFSVKNDITPPPANIRAAFYYPWFKETWGSNLSNPFTVFHPTAGFYSSDDLAVTDKHIQQMTYAGFDAAIASWWGQGTHNETTRVPALINSAKNNSNGRSLKWALYYEKESVGDPSVSEINGDLAYIKSKYAGSANYLAINGKPVIFVFTDGGDGCAMAQRWQQANANQGFYVVLKVFGNYTTCAYQPGGWHQYGPAAATDSQGKYSYTVSPGFWKKGETSARLPRLDATTWANNIDTMLKSGAQFQLVTTFNEWGEGTAVEPATEWASASGYGTYIDILHQKLNGFIVTDNAPTVPTNLKGTAASPTQVDLSWGASTDTDSTPLASYKVYRNGTATALATVAAPQTNFSDTTAKADTTYQYTVSAVDTAGKESAHTPAVSITTPPTLPICNPITTPPTGFTVALANGTKTVNLSWSAPTPKTGECAINKYVVTRNGQVISSPTTTSDVDSTTNYNTTYTYLIQAHDTNGTLLPAAGLASTPATITTPQLADTSKPDVPVASATVTSTTSVTVSWAAVQDNPKNTANSGIAGYKVFRDGTKIATTPANATSYGDQFNYVKGQTYSFTVSAFDAATPTANESAQSSPSAVTPNPSTGASYVVVGAGDIGGSSTAAQPTGNQIAALNPAANAVLTLGDNAYSAGTASQFSTNYDPWWGPFKPKTYPSPGNHDYGTSGASAYYAYFGANATGITGHTVSGSPNQGYYAYNIGSSWRFYSLNSEANQSAANTWLAQDLQANPKLCTVSYWHKPPFSSSSTHASDGYFTRSTFVQNLYNSHGDIILAGHQHNYERFARMTPSNTVDPATGLREFVAGTGGAGLYGIGSPQPGSEVRNSVDHGILILTINDNGTYHWEFRATGTYRDSGNDTCRQ